MTTRILMDAEPGHCEICDARPPESADFIEVLRWIGQWQEAHPMDYAAGIETQFDTPSHNGTDGWNGSVQNEIDDYRDYVSRDKIA